MITDEDIQEMKDMYRSTKYSKREIGEFFDVSLYMVNKCLSDTKPDMLGRVRREFARVGYKLLSEDYVNNHTPLKYECPKHGEQIITWNSFHRGERCVKCNDEERRQLMHKKIKKAFEDVGYTLLNEEYVGANEPIKYLCPKHGEQESRWDRFQGGNRCAECYYDEQRTPYEYIEKAFEEVGYTLLSEEYVGANEPIKYLCPKHGEQSVRWSSFQAGSRCAKCSHENQRGSYNTTLAERNKQDWIQAPAIIYLVKLSNNNESFIKIGITTDLLSRRMASIPYKYESLAMIHTNLYNATFVEEELLGNYSNHKYEPDDYFGGHTECLDMFALNPLTTQFKKINRSIQEEAA